MPNHCFARAQILLPAPAVDVEHWACLACDQFTSQPEYWQQAEELTQNTPSALHLVLPEVYLEQPDVAARIAAIQTTMQQYKTSLLTQQVNGFVYLERTTQSGTRAGLVGQVDLEQYSYAVGATPAIRPTESTVVDRIPPRLAVRRGASLESPHVMMLMDDAAGTVLEPLAAQTAQLRPLYQGQLMLGGGTIQGWAIEDESLCAQLEQAVAALGSPAAFAARYPQAAGSEPLTLAVGDGNHSLATAKAHWEEIKATLTPAQQQTHPARFCLVELCNIHSPAIGIEPIHRVLFGTSLPAVEQAFTAFLQAQGALLAAQEPGCQTFALPGGAGGVHTLHATAAVHPLAVGTAQTFLDGFVAQNPGVKIDYIHGEQAVQSLCQNGQAVGILLPEFAKSDIFKGVVLGGVLPRKTFSMGHAEEKRYYLECRSIL